MRRGDVAIVRGAAVRVARVGKVVGRLDDGTLFQLNRTLAFVIGLAE